MEILRYPSDLLRQRTSPVVDFDKTLKEMADSMVATMIQGRGVGLAAPQVGSLISLFVVQVEEGKPLVFVNPEIIGTSVETIPFEEGCLSIPGMYEEVIRPEAVQIQAWNVKGRRFKMECSGWLGRVFQHEMDHLKGVLFIDYLSAMKRERLLSQYSKNQKK